MVALRITTNQRSGVKGWNKVQGLRGAGSLYTMPAMLDRAMGIVSIGGLVAFRRSEFDGLSRWTAVQSYLYPPPAAEPVEKRTSCHVFKSGKVGTKVPSVRKFPRLNKYMSGTGTKLTLIPISLAMKSMRCGSMPPNPFVVLS